MLLDALVLYGLVTAHGINWNNCHFTLECKD